jgi:hypothetical protein
MIEFIYVRLPASPLTFLVSRSEIRCWLSQFQMHPRPRSLVTPECRRLSNSGIRNLCSHHALHSDVQVQRRPWYRLAISIFHVGTIYRHWATVVSLRQPFIKV